MTRARPLAALLVATAVLGASGCKTVADGKVIAKMIKEAIETSGRIATVACPAQIPLGMTETNRFRCEVVWPADHTVTIYEIAMDEAGGFSSREVTADPP